jgi:hypothetical protein
LHGDGRESICAGIEAEGGAFFPGRFRAKARGIGGHGAGASVMMVSLCS